MPVNDLSETLEAERLGDASDGVQAIPHYREALTLLLAARANWTGRESFRLLREALERIQKKIRALQDNTIPPTPSPSEEVLPGAELSVYKFSPGTTVRVRRTFSDYDGQEVPA